MSTALIAATDRARAWFVVLASKGIDLTTNAHLKVKGEGAEFADDPCLEEAADVYISLVGALAQRGWSPDDLGVAVDSKMAVNEKRNWVKMPDGTYQHATVCVPQCRSTAPHLGWCWGFEPFHREDV